MATYSIASKLGTYHTGVESEDTAFVVAKFVASFVDARGDVIGEAWYQNEQTGKITKVKR